MAALLVGGGSPSLAQDQYDIPPAEAQALHEFWDKYKVPKATQDQLLADLAAGEVWDALDGVDPVKVTEKKVDGLTETVEAFPDGSIVVSSIETPSKAKAQASEGQIGVMSVGSCRTGMSGTGYVNWYDCKASSTTGTVTIGFYISYSITQGYDSIISVNSPYVHAEGGTAPTPSLTIPKKAESSTGSAYASAKTTFTGFGSSSSRSLEMRALVGRNTAWTRWESGL